MSVATVLDSQSKETLRGSTRHTVQRHLGDWNKFKGLTGDEHARDERRHE